LERQDFEGDKTLREESSKKIQTLENMNDKKQRCCHSLDLFPKFYETFSQKVETKREIIFYSQWCERLA
jgi:hypothetical protein